jgi:predicted TIM-barrel fold metal-dependent hydrolase
MRKGADMLIDIHVHTTRITGINRPNGSRYPTPRELIAMMDAAGIDMAVVLCAISPECRYCFVTPEEILDICAEFPDRLIPFANLDPRMLTNSTESNFTDLIHHYKSAGCRGIGEYMPNLPFDDPLNMNLFAQLEEAGLPLIFHFGPTIGGCYGCFDELGLPRLENVLKQFPNLILLGHSQPFWAEISRDVTEENRNTYPKGPVTPGRVVELMREYPNLHGDLSAGSGYNAITRDPEFGYRFLEEFQDRLYFGTDICNVPQETPIVEYFRQLKQESLISSDAYERIAWRNAAKLCGLAVAEEKE